MKWTKWRNRNAPKPVRQSSIVSSAFLDPFPEHDLNTGGFVAVTVEGLNAVKEKARHAEKLEADLRVAWGQRDTYERQWLKALAAEKPYKDSIIFIRRIINSTKHKDPINDILCECNRADRLAKESAQKGSNDQVKQHPKKDTQ
jgi:hypothetical protein